MLFAEKIFEEGIDMHSPHPSFQSDGVLLYLLCRLTFGNIRWLNSKILSELAQVLISFASNLTMSSHRANVWNSLLSLRGGVLN